MAQDETNNSLLGAVVISAVLLMVTLALVSLVVFTVDREDAADYQALIVSSDPSRFGKVDRGFTACQQREDVTKSVLYTRDQGRLQMILHADQSELVATSDGDDVTLVEHLQGVSCRAQDEVYYVLDDGRQTLRQKNGRLLLRDGDPADPDAWMNMGSQPVQPMQKVRCFDADAATYQYNESRLLAELVHLEQFRASGHSLIGELDRESATLSGLADRVEVSLGEENLQFRAHHLKATLSDSGDLL